MLEHHQSEGRTPPPVYTPEELSWLTGIPDAMPGPFAEKDRVSGITMRSRRAYLDVWLDQVMDRLIALRDAIDAPTEDMEEDAEMEHDRCLADDDNLNALGNRR